MQFNITINLPQETAEAYASKKGWDLNPETLESFMIENIKSEFSEKISEPAVDLINAEAQRQVSEQAKQQADALKEQVKENIIVEVQK